jgi:hypothetical protein
MDKLPLPQLYLVEQHFESPEIADIPKAVHVELSKVNLTEIIHPGDTVAIAVGSRGIKRIDSVISSVVREMVDIDARPFIVPAMGSHGGGTAEEQRAVLAGYGINEEAMGCEIRSSMDVVVIGETEWGKILLDRHASEADHIVIVNRIKPHTRLIGEIESGLVKMCLIGLGNREGARTYHRAVEHHPWMDVLERAFAIMLRESSLVFGIAILQNAYEGIGKLVAVKPGDFLIAEPRLLNEAREMMGRLPFQDIDLLIVDEMGKDISGTGMDTTITGRKGDSPMRVARVFVRDLTSRTRGNALGIGLADFTTRRLVDKIDFRNLYVNSQTAHRTDACKIPMTLDTDYEVLKTAVDMAGFEQPEKFRIVWIKNTLELTRILVSEAYLDLLKGMSHLRVLSGPIGIEFDSGGNLKEGLAELLKG